MLLMPRTSIGYGMPYEDFVALTLIPSVDWWNIMRELDAYLTGTGNLIYEDCLWVTRQRGLSDLFTALADGEQRTHLMIYPTITMLREWRYRDKTVEGFVHEINPKNTKATYLDTPFEEYDIYMDRNGVEIASPGGDPALIPGIPPVLQWWLLRYKVLDRSGVAKLRPMVVEWA